MKPPSTEQTLVLVIAALLGAVAALAQGCAGDDAQGEVILADGGAPKPPWHNATCPDMRGTDWTVESTFLYAYLSWDDFDYEEVDDVGACDAAAPRSIVLDPAASCPAYWVETSCTTYSQEISRTDCPDSAHNLLVTLDIGGVWTGFFVKKVAEFSCYYDVTLIP